MKRKIILFTRAPRLGVGKSRLSPLLNEEERLDLFKKLLERTVGEIRKTDLPYSIHYEGLEEDISYLGSDLVEQKGQGLGQAMYNALAYELEENDSVVLIGSDLVNLSSKYILDAFKYLEETGIVLGPTDDGGYGLIGMTEALDVFSGIKYSTEEVLADTLDKAREIGEEAAFMKYLRDVDEPKDLVREEIGAKKVEILGHGEYNLNYRYDDDYVFRINLASQLHLGEDQILYEYNALKELEPSGVTPKVFKVKKKGKWIPKGYLTMEFLHGRPLNYDTDMNIAAYLLAKVHNHPFDDKNLIYAEKPFQTMYEEFTSMFSVYLAWQDKDDKTAKWIEKLLAIAYSRGISDKISRPCIINTELNNKNFIIGDSMYESYIIDWEKPIIGDCEQDLAHFTVPTTTNWKTDKIMTRREIDSFLNIYEKYRKVDRELYDKYYMFNCLRGITWCSMAKVEYSGDRALTDGETLEKINLFLSDEFIEYIYKEFYEVYDVKK